MFYAVYYIADGALWSIETTEPSSVPDGMQYKPVVAYENLAWNPQTLEFEASAAAREPIISRKAFIERFTPTEWISLVALKSTDPVVAAVFERLGMLDFVELDSAFVAQAGQHFVAQGYLTQQRLDEVLA